MDDQATAPEGTPAHEKVPSGASPTGRSEDAPHLVEGSIINPRRRTQALVGCATLLCYLIFWWAGERFRIPAETGYEASLLQQPSPVVSVLITGVVLAGCVVIGTVIAGGTWFYAGLLAATLGLTALSIRGGPMRYVIFHAQSTGTTHRLFFALLLEQVALFAMVAGLWRFLWRKYERVTPLEEIIPENASRTAKDGNGSRNAGTAIAVQIGVMALVLLLLLTQTDVKKQVLVSVFLAGMIGTAVAENFFADRRAGGWYWVGPFAIGAAGYLLAQFQPDGWATGQLASTFSSGAQTVFGLELAKPLPLDYASAACAGALFGYWVYARHPILSAREVLFRGDALEPIVAAPSDRSTTPSPTHNAGSNGRK